MRYGLNFNPFIILIGPENKTPKTETFFIAANDLKFSMIKFEPISEHLSKIQKQSISHFEIMSFLYNNTQIVVVVGFFHTTF